jgi:hypothetical protein
VRVTILAVFGVNPAPGQRSQPKREMAVLERLGYQFRERIYALPWRPTSRTVTLGDETPGGVTNITAFGGIVKKSRTTSWIEISRHDLGI